MMGGQQRTFLVAVSGELGVDVRELARDGGGSSSTLLLGGDLALVVSLNLDLPLGLELVDGSHVVPANLVRDPLDGGVLAAGLESENAEGGRDDHLLLTVKGRGDTLVQLQSLKSSGTTGSLVGDHSADSLVEDARRSTLVEGTSLAGLDQVPLVQVGVVAQLREGQAKG